MSDRCTHVYNSQRLRSLSDTRIWTKEQGLRALHTIDLLEQALADSETNLQMQVAYTKELEQRQARLVEALKPFAWSGEPGPKTFSQWDLQKAGEVLREIGERE